MYKTTSSWRKQSREGSFNIYRRRDNLRNTLDSIKNYENTIKEILYSNNKNIDYISSIYEECQLVEGLENKLKERLFEFICNKKNEFYSNELKRLSIKDKALISKHIEDINKTKFKLDKKLIEKYQASLIEGLQAIKVEEKKKYSKL